MPGAAHLFAINSLPVRVAAPVHQILIGDWRNPDWVELATLSSRTFIGNLADPSTVTFTMPGDSPESLLLNEGISDVKWVRDGVPIFWGRLTQAVDTVERTTYDIACTCTDYRGLLENREIQSDGSTSTIGIPPLQYDSTWYVEDIIWDLINHTQIQLGGDLGIRKGVFPHSGVKVSDSGVLDPLEFKNSDKIWGAIKTVLSMDPSVELNIDAVGKKLNVSYPFRGTDRGAKLDYGGLIASAHRTVNVPGQFANFTRTWYSGEGDLNKDAQTLSLPDLPNRPEGRWDTSFHAADLQTHAGQVKAARYNFNKASRILPTMDLQFAVGAWDGPNAVWIGDPVTVIVRRGRLDINDRTRVFSVNLTLDSSNVETVTVTVGLPKLDPFKSLTDDLRKLKQH